MNENIGDEVVVVEKVVKKNKKKPVETREEKLDKLLGSYGFVRTDFNDEIIANYLSGGRKLSYAIVSKFREKEIKELLNDPKYKNCLKEKELIYIYIKRKHLDIPTVIERLDIIKWIKKYLHNVDINIAIIICLEYYDTIYADAIVVWDKKGRDSVPPAFFDKYVKALNVNIIRNVLLEGNNSNINKENLKGYLDKIYDEVISKYKFENIIYDEYLVMANDVVHKRINNIILEDVLDFLKKRTVNMKIIMNGEFYDIYETVEGKGEDEGATEDENDWMNWPVIGFAKIDIIDSLNHSEHISEADIDKILKQNDDDLILYYPIERINKYNYTKKQLIMALKNSIINHNIFVDTCRNFDNRRMKYKIYPNNVRKCSEYNCLNCGSQDCLDLKCGRCCTNYNCRRHYKN